MSVNRKEAIKPLLYLPTTEPFPEPEILGAIQAVVIDAVRDPELTHLTARATGKAAGCLLLARTKPAEVLTEDELGPLLGSRIDGIVLSGCRGPADVQKLDVMLKVAEAAGGIPAGRTALLAEYAITPASVLSPHSLAGVSSRLSALIFDASALAEACGCIFSPDVKDKEVPAAVIAGRAAVVLRASEAGIVAYDILPAAATEEASVGRCFATSLRNGFSAVVARSPRQITLLSRGTRYSAVR
ncbi:aldolase [Sinorhizobium numidicum]|uniref:Aldolase n=1 Tax=Sinorhizobium numidicum TaxID=680248 RepID=A0ABY8CXW3_9HYPH|nr:aldolase [Sinorhizobium numidicum]WEX78753.1 aldolase [Sinorhizobium numidicum]WEX82150.1 aldolase [Sinorhizobium numidicum]